MISKTARDNILAIAEAYAKATGLALTTVSKRFHGNYEFFGKLRAGTCDVELKKLGSMVRAFGDRWPPKTAWPKTRLVSFRRPKPIDARS